MSVEKYLGSPPRASSPIDFETLDFLMNPMTPDKPAKNDFSEIASPPKLDYADEKFSFSDEHRTFQMKKIKFILSNWNKSTPPVIKVSIVCTNDTNALRSTSESARPSVEVRFGKETKWTPAARESGFEMERDR